MMPTPLQTREDLIAQLANPLFAEGLLDPFPDLAFSVKDREGRYLSASQALLDRCGLRDRKGIIGKTAFDFFPSPMAARYDEQDRQVFLSGQALTDQLDLTLYPDRSPGWCLSTKIPLRDREEKIIALACLSKDLNESAEGGVLGEKLARAIDAIHESLSHPLRIEELAKMAALSPSQFERRMKKLFGLSAGQFIMRARMDAAARQLQESNRVIAEIAQDSGFYDHSAFTRQFKGVTGLTPSQYRLHAQKH